MIYVCVYICMCIYIYIFIYIFLYTWYHEKNREHREPIKTLGSQPRRSFLTVLFSPLGRTAAVVVPTGLTQTYGFEKKNMIPYKTHQNQAVNVWFIPKPLSMAVFIATSPEAAGRWDKLLITSTPLSLLAPGIINHYGPNMIDGGTIYINRLSS